MSANLEGADFIQASLRATDFAHANIKRAFFAEAHLDYASFIEAHLESALLDEAHLEGANLSRVHLEGASLIGVHLKGSLLRAANIEGADLRSADLKETDLREAHLEGSNLDSAHLEGANFHSAHLEGADLGACHLEGASLQGTHMEGKRLNDTDYQRINQAMRGYGIAVPQLLPPTDLRMAYMNEATTLNDLTLSNSQGCVKVADVRWGGINLAVISWNQQGITRLGDENEARKPLDKNGKPKDHTTRIREWEAAVRAYRQLAVALRTQGMNEVADRFAYRAQFCQRRVTHFGGLRSLPAYLGSLLLDLISGYGYRPARSLATYALVIGVFALIYGILGQSSHPLNPQEAVVISMTAFHGRGFFATSFSPGDPQAIAAAIEAFVGLFIEVTFIATFTQRFFSR